ncbi:MAG: sensor domain-containing diguanylate cyclase [Anaerolineae bacterium]|nr:sensor domain-containing diguanylate cyclase [Anaerolineae bacterium]MDK1080767.1 sensor domain-containing diguanylate cyclase [Anaerolineae bacterium]
MISIQGLVSPILEEILQGMYDGVCIVAPDRKVIFWNQGAERITGRPSGQVLGIMMGSDILQHLNQKGYQVEDMDCPLTATLLDGQPREAEVYMRHLDGYPIPIQVKTFPIKSDTKKVLGAAEIFSDNQNIKRLKRRKESMDQTTAYDPLTLVGNRKHLESKLRAALLENQYSGQQFGILFIDIDRFKSINDQFGHVFGDKVLHAVANTLRHNLRDTDTCGRWGGEEFLGIILDVDEHALKILAEKLRLLVSQAFVNIGGKSSSITISIGATLAKPGDTIDMLVHRADKLMYQSKSKGRNRISIG